MWFVLCVAVLALYIKPGLWPSVLKKRDIPLGLIGSMSVITAIYCTMALVLSMMQPYTAIDRSAAYLVASGVLVGDEPDGEVEGVVAGLEEAAVAPMPMPIVCCYRVLPPPTEQGLSLRGPSARSRWNLSRKRKRS
jgi:hypothetical protein